MKMNERRTVEPTPEVDVLRVTAEQFRRVRMGELKSFELTTEAGVQEANQTTVNMLEARLAVSWNKKYRGLFQSARMQKKHQ